MTPLRRPLDRRGFCFRSPRLAVGNAVLLFEKEGHVKLEALMRETDNRALSDRAWRILHLRQGDQFFPITEEQDAAAQKLHPWWSGR